MIPTVKVVIKSSLSDRTLSVFTSHLRGNVAVVMSDPWAERPMQESMALSIEGAREAAMALLQAAEEAEKILEAEGQE